MGSNTFDPMMEDGATYQATPQKQMWSEQKQAAIHDEIKRMHQLPAKSTYVAHRMRVLNKILQLISLQNYGTGAGIGVAFCWALTLKGFILGVASLIPGSFSSDAFGCRASYIKDFNKDVGES